MRRNTRSPLLLLAVAVATQAETKFDLQAAILEACRLDTPYGEACGTVELPAGGIDLTRTVVIGDLDATPNTFGKLDARDGERFPRDGRVFSLTIRGQGIGHLPHAGDVMAGSWLRWKGPPGQPMIRVRGASHLTLEGFGLHGMSRASHCILAESNAIYGQNDGQRLHIGCTRARVGVEYTDGEAISALYAPGPQVNGRSEAISFDLWMREVAIGLRWNANNTQGAKGRLHIENWGSRFAEQMGQPLKPQDPDSCGGGAKERGGSPTVACAIDHRQGNLVIERAVIASHGNKGPNDADYHASGAIIEAVFRDSYHESSTGSYFVSMGGRELGAVRALMLDNVNIYDFRSSGIVPCLHWGANAALISTSFWCMNTAGGAPQISIDTHPGSPVGTTLDLRNVRLNTRGGGGASRIVIDPDGDGNISGQILWAMPCDDEDGDGLCDFDGKTDGRKLHRLSLP